MSDQVVSIMSGDQTFPETTAHVQLSVVDVEASREKGRMLTHNMKRRLVDEAEWGPGINQVRVGVTDKTMVTRSMVVCADKSGSANYGSYLYKVGGIQDNSIVNVSVRATDHAGNSYHQETLLFLSVNAPMLQVVTNYPYEPLAITNNFQVFKGRAWPLRLRDIKELELKPKPQYALRYLVLEDATENDLLFLDFDTDKFSWEDMVPKLQVNKAERTGHIQVAPAPKRGRRQVRPRKVR